MAYLKLGLLMSLPFCWVGLCKALLMMVSAYCRMMIWTCCVLLPLVPNTTLMRLCCY